MQELLVYLKSKPNYQDRYPTPKLFSLIDIGMAIRYDPIALKLLKESSNMSFLDSIKHVLSSIGHGLLSIFSKEHLDQGKEVIVDIISIVDHAIPAVQIVADLSHNVVAAGAVTALKDLDITLEAFKAVIEKADTSLDVSNARGLQLSVASEVLKNQLMDYVKSGGQFKLGNMIIDTVEGVLGMHDSELRTAVQAAFQLIDATKKIAAKDSARSPTA